MFVQVILDTIPFIKLAIVCDNNWDLWNREMCDPTDTRCVWPDYNQTFHQCESDPQQSK